MGVGAVALLLLIALIIGLGNRRGDSDKTPSPDQSFPAALQRVRDGQSVITVTDPEQMVQLIEDEQAKENVNYVTFSTADLNDPRFHRVSELPQLETLVFHRCQNGAEVLESVQIVESLRQLSFESTRLDGDDVRALVQLKQLERIRFQNTMSHDEIEQLRALMPEVEIEWIAE